MLQKVDLSYNEIKELPTEIQELVYVSSFKIRHNQLSQLPETFWNLTKLTSVDLSKWVVYIVFLFFVLALDCKLTLSRI